MSDEVKSPELKVVNSKKSTKKSTEECKCDVSAIEQAPPSTVYEVLMARMTPEQMAGMGVKLIQVNGEELFWMTSVGQLYTFDHKKEAIVAEYTWLMSKPN
jgi:hypothetical protein